MQVDRRHRHFRCGRRQRQLAGCSARTLGNAHFTAMNAEEMNFPDGSFDIVFGSAIIHHPTSRAYAEIARVLRPGGQAIRRAPSATTWPSTPSATGLALRTPDEHLLLRPDIEPARQYFRDIDFPSSMD
ncbi:MAG: class I SAM-dependent methyltransferase [Geminicoccaceae bacterium]